MFSLDGWRLLLTLPVSSRSATYAKKCYTVYVYNCEIFFTILAQKILDLVSDQEAFYKPGSTLGV
jgi:hypothetical protein